MKEDVGKGVQDFNAAVVPDEAELAETGHEEIDAGGTDHFSEDFLADGGDDGLGRAVATEAGKLEQCSSQTLLGGVEVLIDEVG